MFNVLSLLLALVVHPSAQRVSVAVKVVDVAGKPVAATPVASAWVPKFPEVKLPLIPMEALYTGADGIATGTVDGQYPIVLSAFDQDKHLGGFVTIYKDTTDPVITLAPMQAVKVEYSVKGLSGPLKTAFVQVQIVVPDGKPNSRIAKDGYAFPLSAEPIYLPPGSYRFWPGAENADGREEWFDVPSVAGVFSTPIFTLTATKVATLAGKAAPELTVVGAMNAAPKVKLSDYRGKWVLLDFWGTWCYPCRSGMPSLAKFYKENLGKRSKFELLAVHDSSQKSVASLKASIGKIVKGEWKGMTLPFPVLLDQAGKSVAAYGIKEFPTQVLIDPQGRIVEGGNLETLKRELAKSRK
jgi:thiol-disulfide isomerase/thioredoxin